MNASARLFSAVLSSLDLAHRDVLGGRHLVPHEILKDDGGLAGQVLKVVLAQVSTVEQNRPLCRIVEPRQKLDDGRLALAVLANQRNPPARLEPKVEVVEHPPGTAGIREGDVSKLESLPDGSRGRHGVRLGP